MAFRVAADAVVLVHAAFVVFALLGGLLVLRWPRLAWAHVPAAAWGVLIEFVGWICPLTPLENYLRDRAGLATYRGEFVEHYVLPMLYPAELTRTRQVWLGLLALAVNAFVYWHLVRTASRRRRDHA